MFSSFNINRFRCRNLELDKWLVHNYFYLSLNCAKEGIEMIFLGISL